MASKKKKKNEFNVFLFLNQRGLYHSRNLFCAFVKKFTKKNVT